MPFVHRTFVCRARITPVGHRRIAEVLTLTRQLYNAALEERVEAWRRCRQSITWQDQFKSLTMLRRDPLYADLRDLDLRIQHAPLQRVDRAFRGFFRRCKAGKTPGFPRFQPASRWRSIELNDASPGMVRRRGRHTVLVVKGLPPIPIRTPRPLPDPAALKTVRIVRKPVRTEIHLCYGIAATAPASATIATTPPITNAMFRTTAEFPVWFVPPWSQPQCAIDRNTPRKITPTTRTPTHAPSDLLTESTDFFAQRPAKRTLSTIETLRTHSPANAGFRN